MKKNVLLLLLAFCCMSTAKAQTTVETALSLKAGENSYVFDGPAEGRHTVYYVYTAPANQGKLLTVTVPNASTVLSLSEDGTYNTSVSGIINGQVAIFPVKPAQKVYLSVSEDGGLSVSITAAISDANVDGGATCDDAIDITAENMFVPTHYDIKNYQTNPTYLAYQCTESGLMEISQNDYMASLPVRIGCDGSVNNVNVSYSKGKYVAKVAVTEGKNYIFEYSLYSSPTIANFKLTHPTEGASCDMPFAAKATGNILPKTAGIYWYQYVTDSEGFMTITSDNSLAGGKLSVYKTCSDYSPYSTIDGYFSLRCKVDANSSYLVSIEKTENTDVDDLFDISVAGATEGDAFDLPIVVGQGKHTVPMFDGTYYYKVNIPAGDSKFLIVDAKAANLQSSNSSVKVYSENNTYTPVSSGQSYVKCEALGGNSYYVVWNCGEGYNSFDFSVSLETINQGDTYSNPIQAVSGVNSLASGTAKYYTFRSSKNGWLSIDTDVMIDVTFPRDGSGYNNYTSVKSATTTKMEIVSGQDYVIKFSNIVSDTEFTLTEDEYKIGESCSNPVPITSNATSLEERVLNTWYEYVAPKSGMVTVSSDIDFEYDPVTYRSSQVLVKVGDCSDYGTNITQSNSEGTKFEGSFSVSEGDVLLVNVVTYSAQTGKTLNISIRDFNGGETSEKPIMLTAGEVTLPLASRSLPVWYSAYITPGEFSIVSDSYFTMSMLKEASDVTPLAEAVYSYDYNTYVSKYELEYDVVEEGTYLFKLDMTYGPTVVTVSGGVYSAISTQLSNDNGISVNKGIVEINSANNENAEVRIYDMEGRLVSSGNSGRTTTYALPKGLYNVKVGNKTSKVFVK